METATLIVPVDNELHLQTENGQVVVSSRVVAERFGKEHSNVTRDIEVLIGGILKIEDTHKDVVAEKSADLFIPSQYQHPQNKQWYPEYLLTKKGFTLLAMGFTGQEALKWKLNYIEAFEKMEQALKEQQSNPYTGLSKELQAIFAIDHKQQEMDSRITKLENTMTIDYGQQEVIRELVNKKVVSVLGGADAPAYKNKTVSKKAFSQLHRCLKRVFEVNSYKNIAVKDFERAKEIIPHWEPNEELKLMIKGANAQMRLGA